MYVCSKVSVAAAGTTCSSWPTNTERSVPGAAAVTTHARTPNALATAAAYDIAPPWCARTACYKADRLNIQITCSCLASALVKPFEHRVLAGLCYSIGQSAWQREGAHQRCPPVDQVGGDVSHKQQGRPAHVSNQSMMWCYLSKLYLLCLPTAKCSSANMSGSVLACSNSALPHAGAQDWSAQGQNHPWPGCQINLDMTVNSLERYRRTADGSLTGSGSRQVAAALAGDCLSDQRATNSARFCGQV